MRVKWGGDRAASDWTPIFGYSREISRPRDAASGLPTGKRQHKPFVITKPIDKLTPLFLGANVAGTPLEGIELLLVNTDRDGNSSAFFTVTLYQPNIVIRRADVPSPSEPPTEQVAFVYQNITWTYEPSGDSAADSWIVE